MTFNHAGRMVGRDKNVTNEISNEGGGNIIDIIELFVQPLVYNMKEFTYI